MGCYESWSTGWVRCSKEDHYRQTPWATHSPRQTEQTQALKDKDEGVQKYSDKKMGHPDGRSPKEGKRSGEGGGSIWSSHSLLLLIAEIQT